MSSYKYSGTNDLYNPPVYYTGDISELRPVPGFSKYWAHPKGKVYLKTYKGFRWVREWSPPDTAKPNVALYENKVKTRSLLCKIIAKTFIENPNGYQYVYNLDGDITNNAADNLAWGEKMPLQAESKLVRATDQRFTKLNRTSSIPVRCTIETSITTVIQEYPSMTAAAKALDIPTAHIRSVLMRGCYITTKQYNGEPAKFKFSKITD